MVRRSEYGAMTGGGASTPGSADGSAWGTGMQTIAGRARADDETAGPAATEVTGAAGPRVTSRRRPRNRGRRLPGAWLLVLVLAVQTVLSVRLVRADTAFEDEATYLWAGHLEWAHWLHGASIPPFASYFSGAPVVYPPIGALADSLGGLTGARLLSLVFMLAATALLWGTARRLFGLRAAFFAAALFAVAGPTLHLGAFATYDALSVALTALAAWCVVRAGDGEGTGWMVAAGTALAMANATAYASAVFDPVVLALALLTGWPAGRRLAARRCAILLVVVAVLVTAGLLGGGSAYLTGVRQTTLARAAGPDSPLSVLSAAWSWTGLILVLAICGVIVSLAGPAELAADVAAGGAGRRRRVGATGAGAAAHLRLTEQACGPGCVVRRHRRRVRGGQVRRGRAGGPFAGRHVRGLRGGAGLPGRTGRQPVVGVLHRLAQCGQLHRDPAPAGRSRQRAPAGRGRLYRSVLPARRGPVAAVVIHPQHRLAVRGQYRRPRQHRRCHRRWQRRRIRRIHHPRLLLPRRTEFRRHYRPGPPPRRPASPRPPLPHRRRSPLWHGTPTGSHGTYVIWRYQPAS